MPNTQELAGLSTKYVAGMALAAFGLVLVLSMTLPAVAGADRLDQVGARLRDRAVYGAVGLGLVTAGFGLMTIGSPGLEVVDWSRAEDDGTEAAPAKVCNNCSAENEHRARYCNQCGTLLACEPALQPASEQSEGATTAPGAAVPEPDRALDEQEDPESTSIATGGVV
jgi:hypothetical protein